MKLSRLRAIALFTVIALSALCLAFFSSASGSTPTVYRNDTKYTIPEYPAEMINGKLHVPVSFFIGLDSIQYEYGTNPAGFYLRNSKTGRFISFSSNASSIMVDSSLVDVSFPIYNSTVYLPLEYCADILSLKIEKKTDGSLQRVRLTDGTQKLSFDELIELYDPTVRPDNPSVIEPGKPNEPSVTPTPADRYLYITVDNCPNESTEKILDVLDAHSTKATFFFDADGIKKYPETVIRAYVTGHGIGIKAKDLQSLSDTNEVLSSVLNFHTRLCRTDEKVTDELREAALKKGYVLWGANADSEDWKETSAREAARNIYNMTFSEGTTVVRLSSDTKSDDIIESLLYYISDDTYITVKVLDPTVKSE